MLFVVIAVGLGLVANTAGAEQSVQTWAGGRNPRLVVRARPAVGLSPPSPPDFFYFID